MEQFSLFDEINEAENGFRLEKFQLLNWGVFNGSIYSVDCKNKSTLLTGQNGSGKTTLVDAIVTLLVPNQIRFYNQSSGSIKKHDRNEESYVLGAYGSRQYGEGLSGKTQYLRDKEGTVSILNGIFYNAKMQSHVSLLQVRYFTGGELQKVFGVTKQHVEIESIYDFFEKTDTKFDSGIKWRKSVSNNFGTVFFGDNFTQYSNYFSQIFGFRSEKALRLFSQIVGLKVLGNLTEFVRLNMLESNGTTEEFEKLYSNYTKLIECDNEIQKTKVQIELLEKVVKTGNEWLVKNQEKKDYAFMEEAVPAWFAKNATDLLETEKSTQEKNLVELTAREDSVKNEMTSLQDEINSIKIDLSNNDTARRIESLDNEIKNLTEKKGEIQKNNDIYVKNAEILEFAVPSTESDFKRNKDGISEKIEKAFEMKSTYENLKYENQKKIDEITENLDSVKKELKSLGKRNSNIPLENIELRAKICRAIKLEEKDLPFAGELIQIKQEEKLWNFAIEKLLHNFALDILVSEKYYKKVTEYVKNTNIGGKLVYLKPDENISYVEFASDDADTVPGKIEVKNGHVLTDWLKNYIHEKFDYLCTDDVNEIAKAKKALSSSGLIKNRDRHEKDDRRKILENFVQVLGWDNTQKRKNLSTKIDELNDDLLSKQKEKNQLASSIQHCEIFIHAAEKLEEFILFEEINVAKIVKNIDSKTSERNKLASSKDIKDLQMKLDSKIQERERLEKNRYELSKSIGRIQNKMETLEVKLQENKAVLEKYNTDEEMRTICDEKIAILENNFPDLCNADSVDLLEKNQKDLKAEVSSKLNDIRETVEKLSKRLSNNMNSIKNPCADLRSKYGDWSAEFNDFGTDEKYFEDYKAFYERLTKDDLPKYQSQFHKYLHNTINEDLIDFNEYINSNLQIITTAIENLNSSLRKITYQKNPDTYLQLILNPSTDVRIRDFKNKLKNSIPDQVQIQSENAEYEKQIFKRIRTFLDDMQKNQNERNFILDLRNWFTFAAVENFVSDNSQKQFYNDSASLSGGEKAKLTYTILASSIAYQFNIGEGCHSFRFVIVDEAFSKSDAMNSEYAMKLFKQLDLQIMVVTPLDKINIVEDYISSIHMTDNKGSNESRLLSMSIEKYRREK